METNRIIVIKNEFAPVVMHPQGHGYYIQWDYKPLVDEDGNVNEDAGTCYSVHAPYRKPTIGLVKYMVTGFYNQMTDRKIYDGFQWNGNTVYLTSENQFNYKALFDIAVQTNGANLPVKIKVGSDEVPNYITFKTIDEFRDFYYACVAHINKCVNDGWDLKDNMDWSVFEAALENVPELPEDVDILTNRL